MNKNKETNNESSNVRAMMNLVKVVMIPAMKTLEPI